MAMFGYLPIITSLLVTSMATASLVMFDTDLYEATVSERAPPGTIICRLNAHQSANNPQGTTAEEKPFIYQFASLQPELITNTFLLESATGELRLKRTLDYEERTWYEFDVVVSNQGGNGLQDEAIVRVSVVDVNDNSPQIVINLFSASGIAEVRENAEPGTFIAHVSVHDNDSGRNGLVNCDIAGPMFHLVRLHQDEYKIVSSTVFDREWVDTLNPVIECQDQGMPPLTTRRTLQVNVEDANDNVPVFTQITYRGVIPEHSDIGTPILRVHAADMDIGQNGDVRYRLHPDLGRYLEIGQEDGDIRVRTLLDRELADLTGLVYAVDGGRYPLTGTATVYISIEDVDDPPQFTMHSYVFGVDSGAAPGTEVGRVVATDEDTTDIFSDIRYSLAGDGVDGQFVIDPDAGVIRTVGELTGDVGEMYTFEAVADNAHCVGCWSGGNVASVVIYVLTPT